MHLSKPPYPKDTLLQDLMPLLEISVVVMLVKHASKQEKRAVLMTILILWLNQ